MLLSNINKYLEKYYQIYSVLYLSYYAKKINTDLNNKNLCEYRKKYLLHVRKMPDYLSISMKILAFILIIISEILNFGNKDNRVVIKLFSFIEKHKIPIYFNFFKFHEMLFQIIEPNENFYVSIKNTNTKRSNHTYDYIVIGSGPGGAISVNKLKKAGFKTLLVEKGNNKKFTSFSYGEMINSYKNCGINVTMGKSNIAYVEGQIVGGGSEVNSGLYHRIPNSKIIEWSNRFKIIEFNEINLLKHYTEIENKLNISYTPEQYIPLASKKLEIGAKLLNLDVSEIPRWVNIDNLNGKAVKMTMQKTYLTEYFNLKGEILENTEVIGLHREKNLWHASIKNSTYPLKARNIINSLGSINSANILLKSKLSSKAGNTFQLHPTVKVICKFDEIVNFENMGVPVHQVKINNERYSFGCSISTIPYLRAGMIEYGKEYQNIDKNWQKMAIYYCMIIPEGYGKINRLYPFNDPYVTYKLTKNDKLQLSKGLNKLCQLLICAGGTELYPSVYGGKKIRSTNDLKLLPSYIDSKNANLMSVHLFSSCPMGEDTNVCVADSYGKVHGHEGLYLSDGSLLPSAPGVNPQGSILALANRNIEYLINK